MRRAVLMVSAVALFLLLAACGTTRHVVLEQLPYLSALERELAGRGPLSFTVDAGTRTGESGCRVEYEVYRPAELRTSAFVVLGHGFLSNLAAMRGWAERWASFGVPTAVLTFCNSTPFAGRHDRNAEDMVALAHALHEGPVVYAGFSAGGLSAYLAAASDPRAAAYVGFDAVDSGGLASQAEAKLAVPSLFLVGEPSSCNAENNILPTIPERSGVTALRVRDALHCYFQDPWQRACESVCGKVVPPESAQRIAATIRCLATAWLLEATGARPGSAVLVEAAVAGRGDWARRVEPLR
jgi:dienelactone hydrolase